MAAEKADDAVVEAIRAELQGRGKPLGEWQPFPEPDADVINLTRVSARDRVARCAAVVRAAGA